MLNIDNSDNSKSTLCLAITNNNKNVITYTKGECITI